MKKESCRIGQNGCVFATEKGRKKLEKTGFGGNARVLHLSIDLLVFLEEICKFMRSEQKRNQNAPGKRGLREQTEIVDNGGQVGAKLHFP